MTDLDDDALIERLYSEGCTPEEVWLGLCSEPGPWQMQEDASP